MYLLSLLGIGLLAICAFTYSLFDLLLCDIRVHICIYICVHTTRPVSKLVYNGMLCNNMRDYALTLRKVSIASARFVPKRERMPREFEVGVSQNQGPILDPKK